MADKLTVGIVTLGCKVNQYESEAIAEELVRRGFEIKKQSEKCSAYIINTCTVTSESDRKARQTIRRMISQNGEAYILVTGCYSQVSPSEIAEIKGIDYICGSSNKMSVADALSLLVKQGRKNDKPEINVPSLEDAGFEKMSISRFDRTRAYVKIEDGCESRCAYCEIPTSRGPIRSKAFDDVINEVRCLTENGCREIVLTGIETGSYGKDLPKGQDLASLLCAIDKIEGIGRVRLGSLDPTVIKEDFADRIKDLHSLAPHFHLSLQSGSSKILALMKRKYNSVQAMQSIERLKKAIPDVKFTTDVIVGFPGETDEDFQESCSFAEKAGFLMIHVFPYSKRPNTVAAVLPDQVNEQTKHERVGILSDISRKIRCKILDEKINKGEIVEILFETYSKGYACGHTSDFIEVRVRSDKPLRSVFRNVRLISHDGDICDGVLAE